MHRRSNAAGLLPRAAIVAVVGADELGGSIAHKLAGRGRCAAVRLIDPAGGIAAGKALDIQQAGAVEGFHTRVTAHDDLDAAGGADVVVIAGPADGPAEAGDGDDAALAALRRLRVLARHAVCVCAGVGHRGLIGRAVAELGMPRRQVLGTAPAALQSALRAIVALELRCAAADVSVGVLGAPPDHLVVPWSAATARGCPLSHLLAPPRLARLRDRARLVWPPGPYALASVTARVCEAVAAGAGPRAVSCFTVLDGELGVRRTVAAVPVELGPTGVTRILEPALTARERVQLETALQAGQGQESLPWNGVDSAIPEARET